MRKTAPVSATSDSLTVSEIRDLAQAWIDDGEVRQLSPATLSERRLVTQKLLWFLKDRELRDCCTRELRSFLAYCSRGHEEERGRWGNDQCRRQVKPRTIKAYHRVLRAFFNWLIEAGDIEASPMAAIKPPLVRDDQVQPFSRDQVAALLAAARKSHNPRRNEALVLLMIDTGARASEVCSLKLRDLNLTEKKLQIVQGKGGKARTLFIGRQTTRALWSYLREEGRDPEHHGETPLFLSDRGLTAGEKLTRSGLGYIIRDLGQEAKIQGIRCSPHVCRHFFAVQFLRAGGNVFTLKELLGHTSLAMTNRYVALAEADLESQHRKFSPGDQVKRK